MNVPADSITCGPRLARRQWSRTAVEGHGMGVVVESSEALERVTIARQIDARCDHVTDRLSRVLSIAEASLRQRDHHSALGAVQEARALVQEVMRLDAIEGEHWGVVAPQHMERARGHGRLIVQEVAGQACPEQRGELLARQRELIAEYRACLRDGYLDTRTDYMHGLEQELREIERRLGA